MNNLAQLLQRHADTPDKVLYRQWETSAMAEDSAEGAAWRDYTVAQVIALAARWQQAFRARGFEKGDRIAICLKNGVQWVAIDQAALGMGLVVVPLYVIDNAENIAAMKQLQRRLAEGRDVVTEGRDQGSEVFPWAEVKVFLTASADERARRRHLEEESRGLATSLESVRAAQARRDEGDRVRPVGAMQPAADAVILETDGLSAADVVDRLAALVAEKRPGASSA
jgi:long-subunit acyl-CoA synthetase (AMP-forming)